MGKTERQCKTGKPLRIGGRSVCTKKRREKKKESQPALKLQIGKSATGEIQKFAK